MCDADASMKISEWFRQKKLDNRCMQYPNLLIWRKMRMISKPSIEYVRLLYIVSIWMKTFARINFNFFAFPYFLKVKYNTRNCFFFTLHGFLTAGDFFLEFFRLSLDTLNDFNLACSIALFTILSVGCIIGSQ